MKIKNKLETIIHYFTSTRQAGHTHTILNGVINNTDPVIVVTHTLDYGKALKKSLKREDIVVSLNNMDGSLRGRRNVLVFDNAAIQDLCAQSLQEINNLDKIIDHKNTLLREKDEDMRDLIDAMLKTVNEELAYHDQTKQQRLKYAEEYSYKAIIKDRHSKEYSNNNEKEALWHDGSRNGHEAAMYSLTKLKNNLNAVKAACSSDTRK